MSSRDHSWEPNAFRTISPFCWMFRMSKSIRTISLTCWRENASNCGLKVHQSGVDVPSPQHLLLFSLEVKCLLCPLNVSKVAEAESGKQNRREQLNLASPNMFSKVFDISVYPKIANTNAYFSLKGLKKCASAAWAKFYLCCCKEKITSRSLRRKWMDEVAGESQTAARRPISTDADLMKKRNTTKPKQNHMFFFLFLGPTQPLWSPYIKRTKKSNVCCIHLCILSIWLVVSICRL